MTASYSPHMQEQPYKRLPQDSQTTFGTPLLKRRWSANDKKSSGKIITFYSYKGGTGRSMSLANVAWVLAGAGKRVLTVDWDLEAPGLHRYFRPFLLDKDLTSSEGVLDLVLDYAVEAITPASSREERAEDWYHPYANVLRYAVSLRWKFPGEGRLDFIPTGRQISSYASRMNSFDWRNFYERLGGSAFLETMKERMREEYDYVLIDSRTGVSDTSGICTIQMPDVLVVCFTLNNQSIDGAASVAASVREQRGIPIYPVPMRVEVAEKRKLGLRKEYARDIFSAFPSHIAEEKREHYMELVQYPYIPHAGAARTRPQVLPALLGHVPARLVAPGNRGRHTFRRTGRGRACDTRLVDACGARRARVRPRGRDLRPPA